MKTNYVFWTFVIILAVAVIGLVLIAKSDNSITGKVYRYASNLGPKGERPIKYTDQFFMPAEKKQLRTYATACCDNYRLAQAGLYDCPQTRDLFESACGVGEEDELEIVTGYCGPNARECFIPLE